MVTHRQLKEAMEYINECVKEGVFEQDQIEELSDEEIVKLANRARDIEE